jgi:hypothetical protein
MIETILAFALVLPPSRFDHPYSGAEYVVWGTREQTLSRCRNVSDIACMYDLTAHDCMIAFNIDFMQYTAIVLRHERAHCNGWSANHEP